jgi:Toprim domain-containing protein
VTAIDGSSILTLDVIEDALRAMSLPVRRQSRRLRAACPICARTENRRHDQALSAAEGVRVSVLLHCFRCQAAFHDLLAALGLNGEPERQFCQLERVSCRPLADNNGRCSLRRAWADSLTSPRRAQALAHAAKALLADSDDLTRLGTGEGDGRLVFAVRDDAGGLIGLERYAMPGSRARARLAPGAPKLLALRGSRRSLWPAPMDIRVGEHLSGTLVVCEGPPTAVTLAGSGFSAVAFSSAGGLREVEAARIARQFLRAIVLADADQVGRAGASVSARLLRECGVEAVMVDLFRGVDDHRDVGDVLRARAVHESLTPLAVGAWLALRLEACLGAT